MVTFRVRPALAVFFAALILPLQFVHSAVPDYKLGDVATEDVITPVPFLVVNPIATDALRQKVSKEVQLIVRQATRNGEDAEAELRSGVATARPIFLTALQHALDGRIPNEGDLATPVYANIVREVARELPKDFPLEKFAPLWVRGQSDEVVVESLIQPLHSVMAQPIVAARTDTTFPANQPVRLLAVKNATDIPTAHELETAGQTLSAGKIISLWRARRLVETNFPAGQEELGRFASSFVRPNAYPDSNLTEILRARRMEGVTVNDTYEAAQVVVHKGQSIDRKALSALAVVREKSLIGTLQTKLEQEQSVAGQITRQTKWIAAVLGAVCVLLVFVFWRLRTRPSSSTALVPIFPDPAMSNFDRAGSADGSADDAWRNRALVAEGKAERAQEAIRAGVLGWMREKIVQTLFRQRTDLLSVQQKAHAEMRELEQRLEQLHTPLQERIQAYEKRIDELEKDLVAKGEENRELLGARIFVAKERLSRERERGRFGSN